MLQCVVQSSSQHGIFSWLSSSSEYNRNATEKLRSIADEREISADSYIRAFYAFGFVYTVDTDPASPGLSDQSDEGDVHSECDTSQENEKKEEEEHTCAINK